ncbi:MAG: hypothetical protein GXY74_09995 [Phycisphaerae bacterium]|nr:hypothetical protein [Phycisphaerae bacterium]
MGKWPHSRGRLCHKALGQFNMEHEGGMQPLLEAGIVQLEKLRPWLSQEQTPALDQWIERFRQASEKLQRRMTPPGPVP